MDIDSLKSAAQDQMAEMMLLMQMDKLPPDFASVGHISSSGQPTAANFSFCGGGSGNVNSHPATSLNPLFTNPNGPYTQGQWREGGALPGDGDDYGSCTACTGNKQSSMAAMREMIFRIAVMQPIYIDPESVKPPKRRNVKISKDPQSVAARHRRERISERIRILQRLVPGGTKMDTASMLDEAIHYVKFLKSQVQSLERVAVNRPPPMPGGVGYPVALSPSAAGNEGGYFPVMKGYPVMQGGDHQGGQLN